MNRRRLKKYFWRALFLIGAILIVVSDLRESKTWEAPKPTVSELKAAYPDATRFEERNSPFHYWAAFSGASAVGAVFITTELPPDIRGYVGPVPTLVGMDGAGAIKRLIVLSNRETPYYMKRVLQSGFLKQFTGRKITEGAIKIDAVSGATITSRAIVGDVNAAAALVAEKIFNLKAPAEPQSRAEYAKAGLLAFALIFALIARIQYKTKSLKWISYAVSIAVVGVYLSIPLSFAHIADVLSGKLPPLSNLSLVVLLAWALITTPIWGAVFCGYACPFGALQEIAWKISPRKKWSVSEKVGSRISAFRYVVLFGIVVAAFPLGIKEAAGFEPYPYFFERVHLAVFGSDVATVFTGLGIWVIVYALFVLLVSVFFKRFWCRFFCPTGACLALLSVRKKIPELSGDNLGDALH